MLKALSLSHNSRRSARAPKKFSGQENSQGKKEGKNEFQGFSLAHHGHGLPRPGFLKISLCDFMKFAPEKMSWVCASAQEGLGMLLCQPGWGRVGMAPQGMWQLRARAQLGEAEGV